MTKEDVVDKQTAIQFLAEYREKIVALMKEACPVAQQYDIMYHFDDGSAFDIDIYMNEDARWCSSGWC